MSMSHEEIIAKVNELYAVAATGDWEKVADLLTEDFVAIEADTLAMAGEYKGKYGLRDLFVKAMGMIDLAGLDLEDITVGKDRAIAVVTMRFADPSLEPAELCEMFRFKDGKCCEIKPYYFDATKFNAAAAAKEASA